MNFAWIASKIIRLFRSRKETPSPPPESEPPKQPIVEFYKHRDCPERSRLNEDLYSMGFVAPDGALRVFYDRNNGQVVAEIEVNDITIDLREARPIFEEHPKWKFAHNSICTWMQGHTYRGEVMPFPRDFRWVRNIWSC